MQNGYQTTIDDKLKEAWSKEQNFINTKGIFRSLIWIISLIISSFIIDILIWKGIGDGNSHGLLLSVINLIAWISHREDHHPEITFSYNIARVTYYTYAIDGLSENDFICASKIDKAT